MLTWFRLVTARIHAVFRTRSEDREFQQELESHAAMLAEDKIRRGMSPEQARRAARLELGSVSQLREEHREIRGVPFIDTLFQDLRYAIRMFRRDLAFAVFAILIVGVGIGGTTTVFSVVNAVLLRPLPFDTPERLVWISNIADNGVDEWKVQVNHFLDLRQQNTSFSDLTGFFGFVERGSQMLTGAGEPERLSSVSVTENFFPFLGVDPVLGRVFTTEECRFDGPRAALLSHSLWRRRFSSDPSIVGKPIVFNETPTTVVGILPESFDFGAVFAPGIRVDLFVPWPLSEQTNRRGNTMAVIGRLNPNSTVESARAEFEFLGKRLTEVHRDRNTIKPKLMLLNERVNGRFRPALLVLVWAVSAVMLIVCANLSNMQLARMAARQKDLAIRVALGAGRRRLVRQLLTESILLSCCGAALGLALAVVATRLVTGLDAFSIPLLHRARVDAPAFGFTAMLALAAGVLFGLLPALRAPATDVHRSLKDTGRGSTQGKRHTWLRGALVVSEVALASVLLVSAGLLIRSFLSVLDVELGYQPERAAATRVDPGSRYPDQAKRNAYYNEVLQRVKTLPGVGGAALTDMLPLGGNRSWGVRGEGQVYERDQYPQAFVRVVSNGYFQAMGIPLLRGRDFTERDTPSSELVVILNQTMARMLWPGENPIGKRIAQDGGRRVVGVVGDVRHQALEEGFTGEMYLPIRQTNDYGAVELVVRTSLPPGSLASSVRAALRPIAPDVAGNEWRTLQQLVDQAISPRRFVVLLLSGFSTFALILASLGIYGVVSYSVSQRTQEIGIRMALGATARYLQGRILAETIGLVSVGMTIGIVAAWGLGPTLRNLLFGVTPTDPLTFAGMVIVLTAVASMAAYLPARRASRIDPMVALRIG
ncbi:MAG: ADOP family duplicated permease [Bryobacteraceae bacterium]